MVLSGGGYLKSTAKPNHFTNNRYITAGGIPIFQRYRERLIFLIGTGDQQRIRQALNAFDKNLISEISRPVSPEQVCALSSSHGFVDGRTAAGHPSRADLPQRPNPPRPRGRLGLCVWRGTGRPRQRPPENAAQIPRLPVRDYRRLGGQCGIGVGIHQRQHLHPGHCRRQPATGKQSGGCRTTTGGNEK